jgi:hypothetical protein
LHIPSYYDYDLLKVYSKVRKMRSQCPEIMKGADIDFQARLNASRQHMLSRGFSMSHPLISGRIPIHPELQGELYFPNSSHTSLTLGQEDFLRFLPEMNRNGMKESFPIGNFNIDSPRQQGFSSSHPLKCRNIPIHPELQGELPIETPLRTSISLGQTDFNHFLPKMEKHGIKLAYPAYCLKNDKLNDKKPTFKSIVNINKQDSFKKEKRYHIKRRKSAMKEQTRKHWLMKDSRSMHTLLENDDYDKS